MSTSTYEQLVASCYSTWGESYYDEYYSTKASYPPIHVHLLKDLISRHNPKKLLDAGCGPASFLREIANQNIDLYGFDLTPEMVTEGQKILETLGISNKNLWVGSVTDPNAYHIPNEPTTTLFDSAICIGVLPHIPVTEDMTVIYNLRNSVKKGGLVILQARNQLFSLFTQNRYTYQFFAEELIQIDKLKSKLDSISNKNLDKNLQKLKSNFCMDLPPIRRGKSGEPGYDEILSRAHNPFILKEQFIRSGFEHVDLLFYHYHCLPPMFKDELGDIFRRESLALENPTDWRGYFMASTFLISGIRQ